jgi:hypothetical protein
MPKIDKELKDKSVTVSISVDVHIGVVHDSVAAMVGLAARHAHRMIAFLTRLFTVGSTFGDPTSIVIDNEI